MEKVKTPVVKRSLFSWILPGNIMLQVLIVFIIMITVSTRVLPLEMQKRIVNEAIRLRKMDLLYLYCALYLGAVILASGLKFLINSLQTYISQRALANIRKELYHHILTLPLTFFRKTQPGMVVSSLISELTTSGNFVGMAIAVPVTNILTLLAFAGYLFWLNPLLAAISVSIYPMVLFLVPLLQKRANNANKGVWIQPEDYQAGSLRLLPASTRSMAMALTTSKTRNTTRWLTDFLRSGSPGHFTCRGLKCSTISSPT